LKFIHKQCRSKQKQKLMIALDLISFFFLIWDQFHSLLLAPYYMQQINYTLIFSSYRIKIKGLKIQRKTFLAAITVIHIQEQDLLQITYRE